MSMIVDAVRKVVITTRMKLWGVHPTEPGFVPPKGHDPDVPLGVEEFMKYPGVFVKELNNVHPACR